MTGCWLEYDRFGQTRTTVQDRHGCFFSFTNMTRRKCTMCHVCKIILELCHLTHTLSSKFLTTWACSQLGPLKSFWLLEYKTNNLPTIP